MGNEMRNITRSLSCCVLSSPKFTRYALWSLDSQQTYHVGQGAYNSCESCTHCIDLARISLFPESSPVITRSLSRIVTYDVTLIVTSMSREPVFFSVTWDRARPSPGSSSFSVWRERLAWPGRCAVYIPPHQPGSAKSHDISKFE